MAVGDIDISRTSIEIDPNMVADTAPVKLNSNIVFTPTNYDVIGTNLVKVRDEATDKFVLVVSGRKIV